MLQRNCFLPPRNSSGESVFFTRKPEVDLGHKPSLANLATLRDRHICCEWGLNPLNIRQLCFFLGTNSRVGNHFNLSASGDGLLGSANSSRMDLYKPLSSWKPDLLGWFRKCLVIPNPVLFSQTELNFSLTETNSYVVIPQQTPYKYNTPSALIFQKW